jgi:hypothetical protein
MIVMRRITMLVGGVEGGSGGEAFLALISWETVHLSLRGFWGIFIGVLREVYFILH